MKGRGIHHHAFDKTIESLAIEGLDHVFGRPGVRRVADIFLAKILCDQDHRRVGISGRSPRELGEADQAGHFEPVDKRHVALGKHDIRLKAREGVERFKPVSSLVDGSRPERLEDDTQRVARDDIATGHKETQAGIRDLVHGGLRRTQQTPLRVCGIS